MKVLAVHETRIKHLLDALEFQNPKNEVPVAAAIYDEVGEILSIKFNSMQTSHDATMHAELLAIQDVSKSGKVANLEGKSIYITLEPCLMCFGAILNSNLSRVIFGAYDKSLKNYVDFLNLIRDNFPRIEIIGGVLEDKCEFILSSWFKTIR
jgi:tRNA(adenine34) deaminase